MRLSSPKQHLSCKKNTAAGCQFVNFWSRDAHVGGGGPLKLQHQSGGKYFLRQLPHNPIIPCIKTERRWPRRPRQEVTWPSGGATLVNNQPRYRPRHQLYVLHQIQITHIFNIYIYIYISVILSSVILIFCENDYKKTVILSLAQLI